MRCILIDAHHRKCFNWQVSGDVTEDVLCRLLESPGIARIDLADDLDLWVSLTPLPTCFQFARTGPTIEGSAVLCGRTKLGDIKAVPLHIPFERIRDMVSWSAGAPSRLLLAA